MIQQVIEYKNILNSLGELMDNSPYKKSYIIEKIGISAPTFYRKLKSCSFTADETLNIIRLLTPEEASLYDLKVSLEKGRQDYKKGKTFSRSEVIEDIKKLLV